MGFYQDIHHRFGPNMVGKLKTWVKINNKLASLRNRKIFLLQCRKHSIHPRHLTDQTRQLLALIDVHRGNTVHYINTFGRRLEHKILNIEIKVTHDNLTRLERNFDRLLLEISNQLPRHIFEEFQHRQLIKYNTVFNKIKQVNISKLNNLRLANKTTIKIKNNWIKNLTNVELPPEVSDFLALGPKFSLQPSLGDLSIKNLLADVENIVNVVDEQKRNLYLAQTTNILTNYIHNNRGINSPWHDIVKKTRLFFKDNPDLIVLKADKGNVTVVWSKQEYSNYALQHLNDSNYYLRLERNPTVTVQTKSNKLITTLKKSKYITEEAAKKYTIYNSIPAKFYCLPKVHKNELAIRPIVSSINAPNSGIARLMTDVLTMSYNKNNDFFIKDSFEFSTFINGFQLPPNYMIVSLDVVSLFTNIHKDLAMKSIRKHWTQIKNVTNIPLDLFLELLCLIFDTTVFTFQDTFYKQVLGTPMGASMSPIISQYVMDDLLDDCLHQLPFKIPFLKKYVDDIICAIPKDSCEVMLQTFNNHNNFLSFTIEVENNNSVPFLDTKLIRREDGTIILDWYQKPTNSGRYLNYHSYHEEKMKINLVLGLKGRIEKICHNTLRINNLKKLYNILIDNGYPTHLLKKLLLSNPSTTVVQIDNNLPNEENNVIIQQTKTIEKQTIEPNIILYRSLPYIKNLTTQIIKVFKEEKATLRIAKKTVLTVNSLFTKLKDKTPINLQNNVVYKIPCNNCQQIYIGQTKRNLQSRLTSHKSDCNRKVLNCALTEHMERNKHQPNYEGVKVLHRENNLSKRLFLEMIEINEEVNSMNKKTDVNGLSAIYTYILKLNKQIWLQNRDNQDSDLSMLE